MEQKETIAKIKITPGENKTTHLQITMPVWSKKEDGKIYVTLALLGGLVTYAKNEADLDVAITEAIKSFVISAEKFGKGFRNELVALGWQLKKKTAARYTVPRKPIKDKDKPRTYNIPNVSPAFSHMMHTGKTKTLSLQV